MNRFAKLFPWLVIAGFTLWVASKAYPRAEMKGELNLAPFAQLPVLDDGRIKPMDSIARTTLLFISARSEWVDEFDVKHPAIEWMLDVISADEPLEGPASDYRVFRIENDQVIDHLGLEPRPGKYRYSLNEIRKNFGKFMEAFGNAQKMDEKKLDIFHAKIIDLGRKLKVYEDLARKRVPLVLPSPKESETWLSIAGVDRELVSGREKGIRDQAMMELRRALLESGQDIQKLSESEQQRIINRMNELVGRRLRAAADAARPTQFPGAELYLTILKDYRLKKAEEFAQNIEKFRNEYLLPLNANFRDTTKFEQEFNHASPFYYSAILYIFGGIFVALSWLGWSTPLRQASMGVAGVALAMHITGLLGRMYLMGRPLVFVTNLYSSALLIGGGAVAFCLLIEYFYRNGVGLAVGCTLGASCVKIAHHLSTDGKDTMGSLVAVLDTNFWLASHVTTITLGYAATYIAGLLGIVYIAWGLPFKTMTKENHVAMGKMIYGVTCFAMFLSFVGTVLGGIWADQSWGRFWGWDPKENGAVLIVIWNALILHARWAGLVKQRGLAVLTIVGIMVTTWSWFGTNQLGVGLHNYGFNKSLADGCRYTWEVCLGIIALGLIHQRFWRSFAGTKM